MRVGWFNRRLPWPLWCTLCAHDAVAVAWVIAQRAGRPLRFVQIGSNDGFVHDPLHAVVRAYGWSGVLVEPVPALFSRLQTNYAGVPGLSFENAAIGLSDGQASLHVVEPRQGDPYWVDQLASFERDTLLSHSDVLPALSERITEVRVDCLTLPSLVQRHALDTIDLLHVDVEGFDYEVLKQIEFAAPWAPAFVVYERQHFDAVTDRAADGLLRAAGYRLVDIWPDRLAYRCSPRALHQP